MCESFVKNGEPTTLVHPSYRAGSVTFDQIRSFYGVEESFSIRTLPSFAKKNSISNIPTSGEISTFLWLSLQILQGKIGNGDIIYSRYITPTFALLDFLKLVPKQRRPTVVYEQHQMKEDHPLLTPHFYNRLDGIICIAELLREWIIDTYDISSKKILTAHDGVDTSKYTDFTTQSARELLDLPLEKNIVMYTGHLYPDKNVEDLVMCANKIDAHIYIVGGYEEDIQRIRRATGNQKNVSFTGFVQPSEIPIYQTASNVLVATADPSAEYYSPLKLFEYMAAGKPIVATRTRAFEEVLEHNKHCLFVEQHNSTELIKSVNYLVSRRDVRKKLAVNNRKASKHFSWSNRARRILDFIDSSKSRISSAGHSF